MGLHSITSFSSVDPFSRSSTVGEVLAGHMEAYNSQHPLQLYDLASKFGQWHVIRFLSHTFETNGCTPFLLSLIPPVGMQMCQRELEQPFWAT